MFMQELREKNCPKKFFHFGENLCFSILNFLETDFTRQFFTRSGINPAMVIYGDHQPYRNVWYYSADVQDQLDYTYGDLWPSKQPFSDFLSIQRPFQL